MTRFAHNASRVAFVHHDQSVILFSQVADLIHRSYIAIHGEYTIGADDTEALSLSFFQAVLQFFHIAVSVAIAHSLAEAHTINDGSVVESIGDDSVLLREETTKESAISIEASSIENSVFCFEEVANSSFEFFVNILRSTDEAHARHTVTAAVHHILCSLNETRMIAQTQIVVSAEVEHFFSAHLNSSCLRAFNETFSLVEASVLKVLQRLLQMFLKFTVHSNLEFIC